MKIPVRAVMTSAVNAQPSIIHRRRSKTISSMEYNTNIHRAIPARDTLGLQVPQTWQGGGRVANASARSTAPGTLTSVLIVAIGEMIAAPIFSVAKEYSTGLA
ncbi:hypothetical protein EG329_000098 [Mollisiaceae sp. DMI_Dod_QoI]|nr:hypothetical protein EG329_000098 [Helotiales sp. DMI_Dod_QoI]